MKLLPFWRTTRANRSARSGILFVRILGAGSFLVGCGRPQPPAPAEPVVLGLGTESLAGLLLIAAEQDFFR